MIETNQISELLEIPKFKWKRKCKYLKIIFEDLLKNGLKFTGSPFKYSSFSLTLHFCTALILISHFHLLPVEASPLFDLLEREPNSNPDPEIKALDPNVESRDQDLKNRETKAVHSSVEPKIPESPENPGRNSEPQDSNREIRPADLNSNLETRDRENQQARDPLKEESRDGQADQQRSLNPNYEPQSSSNLAERKIEDEKAAVESLVNNEGMKGSRAVGHKGRSGYRKPGRSMSVNSNSPGGAGSAGQAGGPNADRAIATSEAKQTSFHTGAKSGKSATTGNRAAGEGEAAEGAAGSETSSSSASESSSSSHKKSTTVEESDDPPGVSAAAEGAASESASGSASETSSGSASETSSGSTSETASGSASESSSSSGSTSETSSGSSKTETVTSDDPSTPAPEPPPPAEPAAEASSVSETAESSSSSQSSSSSSTKTETETVSDSAPTTSTTEATDNGDIHITVHWKNEKTSVFTISELETVKAMKTMSATDDNPEPETLYDLDDPALDYGPDNNEKELRSIVPAEKYKDYHLYESDAKKNERGMGSGSEEEPDAKMIKVTVHFKTAGEVKFEMAENKKLIKLKAKAGETGDFVPTILYDRVDKSADLSEASDEKHLKEIVAAERYDNYEVWTYVEEKSDDYIVYKWPQ